MHWPVDEASQLLVRRVVPKGLLCGKVAQGVLGAVVEANHGEIQRAGLELDAALLSPSLRHHLEQLRVGKVGGAVLGTPHGHVGAEERIDAQHIHAVDVAQVEVRDRVPTDGGDCDRREP